MNTTDTELRQYELMLLLSGELPEKDFERELAEVKKLMAEHIGKITYEELWGKRNLSYKIKKQSRAYYIVFNFEADPSKITDLNMNIKIYPAVLRHFTMALPTGYDPLAYKTTRLKESDRREGADEKEEVKPRAAATTMHSTPRRPEMSVPMVDADPQEKLKKVEKKLEQILENPDIDVR